MKFLAILLSMYILFLNCVPCSDQENCENLSQEQTYTATTDHSGHQHDVDFCTPFCTCSCCGQTCGIQSFHTNLFPHFSTLVSQVPTFQTSLMLEVFLPIWQPPKIS